MVLVFFNFIARAEYSEAPQNAVMVGIMDLDLCQHSGGSAKRLVEMEGCLPCSSYCA